MSLNPLPINSARLVRLLSKATVVSFIDAIVELITNSDDSYKRLEAEGYRCSGNIVVEVERKKGGKGKLLVRDFAEGMSKEALKRALEFGGEASGLKEGKSVRGCFGRGLKEAIISLGRGYISTIYDDTLYETVVLEKDGGYYYESVKSTPAGQEIREKLGILEGNGTVVEIVIENDRIKIPTYKTLKEELENHYALRDILKERKVFFVMSGKTGKGRGTKDGKISCRLLFKEPVGREVLKEKRSFRANGIEEEIEVAIFEADDFLDSPKSSGLVNSKAGLLIKTEGAIIDNQLFRFVGDPIAYYFFGYVFCRNLHKLITSDEAIVDINRAGLN